MGNRDIKSKKDVKKPKKDVKKAGVAVVGPVPLVVPVEVVRKKKKEESDFREE